MIPDDPVITPGDDADTEGIHTYNAPLYWSVYEYCWKLERRNEELVNAGGQGQAIDMSEGSWQNIIDYVAENLLPYGLQYDLYRWFYGDGWYFRARSYGIYDEIRIGKTEETFGNVQG